MMDSIPPKVVTHWLPDASTKAPAWYKAKAFKTIISCSNDASDGKTHKQKNFQKYAKSSWNVNGQIKLKTGQIISKKLQRRHKND